MSNQVYVIHSFAHDNNCFVFESVCKTPEGVVNRVKEIFNETISLESLADMICDLSYREYLLFKIELISLKD